MTDIKAVPDAPKVSDASDAAADQSHVDAPHKPDPSTVAQLEAA